MWAYVYFYRYASYLVVDASCCRCLRLAFGIWREVLSSCWILPWWSGERSIGVVKSWECAISVSKSFSSSGASQSNNSVPSAARATFYYCRRLFCVCHPLRLPCFPIRSRNASEEYICAPIIPSSNSPTKSSKYFSTFASQFPNYHTSWPPTQHITKPYFNWTVQRFIREM